MPLHLPVYWPPPVPHSFRAASGPVTSFLPLVGLPPILPSCPAAESTFAGAFTFTQQPGRGGEADFVDERLREIRFRKQGVEARLADLERATTNRST